jgi:hypothetical protein
MRTRTASLAFAMVAAVAIVAGPVTARSSTPISITLEVNLDAGVETITDQTNFCEGTAESDAWITGGGRTGGGTLVFHVGKLFTCAGGDDTLLVELHAASNRPHGGTTGGWTVVEGTGAYAGASGGGSIVGVFTETGITDQYEGTIVR